MRANVLNAPYLFITGAEHQLHSVVSFAVASDDPVEILANADVVYTQLLQSGGVGVQGPDPLPIAGPLVKTSPAWKRRSLDGTGAVMPRGERSLP